MKGYLIVYNDERENAFDLIFYFQKTVIGIFSWNHDANFFFVTLSL